MKELDHRSGIVRGLCYASVDFARKKDEHWAHLFSFPLDDIMRNLVKQTIVAFHRIAKVALEFLHFGADGKLYFVDYCHNEAPNVIENREIGIRFLI